MSREVDVGCLGLGLKRQCFERGSIRNEKWLEPGCFEPGWFQLIWLQLRESLKNPVVSLGGVTRSQMGPSWLSVADEFVRVSLGKLWTTRV
jgi:hypothetical protein